VCKIMTAVTRVFSAPAELLLTTDSKLNFFFVVINQNFAKYAVST